MTKKDYEAIAAILRRARTFGNREDGSLVYGMGIEQDFCYLFEQGNERFDCSRFLAACRGEDYKGENGRTSRYSQASR